METEQQSATSTPAATQPASVTPTPAPAPDAQTPATPAAVIPAPAPIPNTGSTTDETMAKVNPLMQKQQDYYQAASDLAKAPVIPPNAPHAKLLTMVSALATGLSALGTAMGTHGAEGGAKEVAEIQGEQQRQKIEAQQAALNQRNQQIQQQITLGDTAGKMAQTIFMMATGPLEWQAKNLEVKKGQQELAQGAATFKLGIGMGMTADEVNGTVPISDASRNAAQNKLGIALGNEQRGPLHDLGATDPAIQKVQAVLADPHASAGDLANARAGLDAATKQHETSLSEANAAQESGQFGADRANKLNGNLLNIYRIDHPNATALPPDMSISPTDTPKDYDRISGLVEKTLSAKSIQTQRDQLEQTRQLNLNLMNPGRGIDPSLVGQPYIDALKKQDPAAADEYAGYASGRLEFPATSVRTPSGKALLDGIVRAYPDFDPSKAPEYVKLRQNFAGGPIGTSLNAYNTSLDHLGLMLDHVGKASTVDVNNPTSPLYQQLATDKAVVASELAKAVSGGSMTVDEKDAMLAAIDGKVLLNLKDPAAYKTKLLETIRLMGGKANNYASQWTAGTPKGVEMYPTVTQALDSTQRLLSGGGAQAGPVAPTGATGKARAGDGKWYYHDAQGNNLGLAQ